ncbi:hypothetical protein CABS01_13413 [Colletotrichum abscissum]|uniref:DUF1479-domain-containing protein n=1 Tax=Colletotrichum abscissum TaxID=1671311 RepID=A0A9P9XU50_9PEZI|nr:uncharacterized protein CABS01_13413 [Colletotrichum abscissum]KAI3559692.1 hypothetical protein CABS02_00667 [Colletotrichum abscissum]KAK1486196.1 hypothetical protein CABS01_13413 [Colletotrichum abscissum]
MPGSVREWPAWPEYTDKDPLEPKDPDFLDTKRAIISQYGAEALRESWVRVCEQLKSVTDEIVDKGRSIIPVFDAHMLLDKGLTEAERDEVKRVGTFVIRGVVPKTEIVQHYADLKNYVAENKQKIQGWPKETPSMLMLYDSPTQNAIRSHPNHLQLQRLLNQLWHDESGEDTSPDPLVYYDGVRDRPPRQEFLGLGPHIDAGSLARWADAAYREVYGSIFSGKPELHDPYDLSLRKVANQELYPGVAHSSVFRSFQGWTALTRTAPSEGTLLVYPNVATVIAYMVLRPFFRPPVDSADMMDATKWTLDDSGFFPGTFKTQSQRLSRSSHPHLRLSECLIHVPKMEPGDTVWWHADVCHAVDPVHEGSQNASVLYIAACPTTTNNKTYVKKQLSETLAGRPPPDQQEGNDLDERTLRGYVGLQDLSAEAKRAFGFGL